MAVWRLSGKPYRRALKIVTWVIGQDVNIGLAILDGLSRGAIKTLPLDTLHALVKDLFQGNAIYVVEQDVLRPSNKEEPTPLGIVPPCITETMTLPTYTAGPPPLSPGVAEPAKPRQPRPGWA